MTPESFSDLIRSRRSMRDFESRPIPQPVLDRILDDARHAPSWSNTRPYCLGVASGEIADRLRAAYVAAFEETLALQKSGEGAKIEGFMSTAVPEADFNTWRPYPPELRERSVEVGVGLYKHLGIQRGDYEGRDAHTRRNCEFFGAPTVILVFIHDSLLPFSANDAGLMLQTLMLSATANGVDSCPLGALTSWRKPADEVFDVPADYKLLTGLALGYATDAHINSFRASHPPIKLVPSR